jgi:hypothetical protein
VCSADVEALRRMMTASAEANGASSMSRPEMEQQGELLAPAPFVVAVDAQASRAQNDIEGDLSLDEQLEIARKEALRWRLEARDLQRDNYGLGHDVWALNAAMENADAISMQLHCRCSVLEQRCAQLAQSLAQSEAARESLVETEALLRDDLTSVTAEPSWH